MRTGCDVVVRLLPLMFFLLAASVFAQSVPRMIIQRAPLAGFSYHEGPALWGQMHEGDVLSLVREAGNPYDVQAVRVDWSGSGRTHVLGYLPRIDNGAIARALDRGVRLQARISRLRESANPRERIEVEVSAAVSGSPSSNP